MQLPAQIPSTSDEKYIWTHVKLTTRNISNKTMERNKTMGDRDLPIYNPDSPGDLDDYWESSASYEEARKNREKSIDDKIGNIESASDWLRALSISLADEDDYIFDRLIEIAHNWKHDAKAQKCMINIYGNIVELRN